MNHSAPNSSPEITVIGVHQRTTPIDVRERLAFGAAELPTALARLRDHAPEGFILATCHRIEIGVLGDAEAALRFLADWYETEVGDLRQHFSVWRGAAAARHVFRLAAGLESAVLGEDQIVAQLKDALLAAHAAGAAGANVHRLLHDALATGKRVRSETAIGQAHVSVVSVCFELARAAGVDPGTQRTAIIGAGATGELALKHLRSMDAPTPLILNRTLARAQALAQSYAAEALPLARTAEALATADLVICATSAPVAVIDAAMMHDAMAQRTRPLLLLDLASPRDVDPAAGALPGVTLIDLDGLTARCEANMAMRTAAADGAATLVEQQVARYLAWATAQHATPTIRALREHAEAIRSGEIARTLARCPELSEREQRAVQAMSEAIVNKLLHLPITTLKDDADAELIGAARRLFAIKNNEQRIENK